MCEKWRVCDFFKKIRGEFVTFSKKKVESFNVFMPNYAFLKS